MHPITLLAFQNELELLEKSANHGVELAGLGMLAAPSIAHMRGKEWSEKNKARAEVAGLGVLAAPSALAVGKAGLAKLKGAISKMPKHAGLPDYLPRPLGNAVEAIGTAAYRHGPRLLRKMKAKAPAIAATGGAAYLGAKAGAKKKEAAPSMSAMMNMHRLADAAKAAKSTVKPLAQAATKLPNATQQATRATQLAGHTAQGGHAWNAAAQAKRAIPL